ncbi:GTP cyclohydrolase FolE2 [Treponema sp.]|uniref:GTP cyclohydrolase FolE2 n=1 Tax=Treponema sp. TaxID=166 RepID=UPI003F0971ED
MIDIQNSQDTREIPLQKVGVTDLSYPVQVLDKTEGTQCTCADVNLFVNLPHNYKGTHMSRFIEIFHRHRRNLGMRQFLSMLEEIRASLDAERAFGSMEFPFFMKKNAPVSGAESIMSYRCTYEGEVSGGGQNFTLKIEVPVTTLCPCSKAISSYGAHNQRGIVTVKLRNSSLFWIEDVIEAVEGSASSGLYSILKRPDEKFVTEHAYDNPRFVEDVVREVYLALRNFSKSEKPFAWFQVECKNFESIHNHNAYACAEFSGS